MNKFLDFFLMRSAVVMISSSVDNFFEYSKKVIIRIRTSSYKTKILVPLRAIKGRCQSLEYFGYRLLLYQSYSYSSEFF